MHGDTTYFNVNRHINPTDVCVASCRLCAFGKQRQDPKSYTMSLEQVWEVAGKGWSEAVTEFHIVGGLHPELNPRLVLPDAARLEGALSAGASESVHDGGDRLFLRQPRRRSAFARYWSGCATPGWIRCRAAARKFSASACGASSAITKSTGDEWLETARTAHQLGLHSNCTMLYGHIENDEDRVDHLVRCASCRMRPTASSLSSRWRFIPTTRRCSIFPRPPGFDDLKNIAVSRLMLDNIPHIKAYWMMMTPQIAQIALRFGADDIDGTVVEEKIYHDAGATTRQSLRREELLRLIRKAGREPVERDTLYRAVDRTESAFTILV